MNRMIWADRLALILTGIFLFAVFLMTNIMIPVSGAPVPFFDGVWIEAWLMTVFPIWLLLRAIDSMAHGGSRRRGRVRATILRD